MRACKDIISTIEISLVLGRNTKLCKRRKENSIKVSSISKINLYIQCNMKNTAKGVLAKIIKFM